MQLYKILLDEKNIESISEKERLKNNFISVY